jgi:hypothetical protein
MYPVVRLYMKLVITDFFSGGLEGGDSSLGRKAPGFVIDSCPFGELLLDLVVASW